MANAAAGAPGGPSGIVPPLARVPSFTTGVVESLGGQSRTFFNKETAQTHCLALIGQPYTHSTCWLCGFDIYFLQKYNVWPGRQGNYVFVDEKYYKTPICEHILPVKVAWHLRSLWKPGITITPAKQKEFTDLVHQEY